MLPKPDDFPSMLPQEPAIARIPLTVAVNLRFPLLGKLVSPFREPPTVPKVSVNEDRQLHKAEHKIRSAGKIAGVALPFETTRGKCARDQKFWSRISAANPRHYPRTGLRGHDVAPMLPRPSFDCRDDLPLASAE